MCLNHNEVQEHIRDLEDCLAAATKGEHMHFHLLVYVQEKHRPRAPRHPDECSRQPAGNPPHIYQRESEGLWYIPTMQYYAAMKMNNLQLLQNNTDDSPRHKMERKKPDTMVCVCVCVCDSIKIRYKHRQKPSVC